MKEDVFEQVLWLLFRVLILAIPALCVVRVVGALLSNKISKSVLARPVLHILWFILSCICVVLILLPVFTSVSRKSPDAIQLSNLIQLRPFLRSYADNHQGNYP